jgi:hypothetical protein
VAKPFDKPELVNQLLDELADPSRTLRGIAECHDVSLEELTLWMTSPEISYRLDLIHSAVLRRTRQIAANFLPSAASAMAALIDDFLDERENISLHPRERRYARETARRAASVLLRFSLLTNPQARTSNRGERAPGEPSPSTIRPDEHIHDAPHRSAGTALALIHPPSHEAIPEVIGNAESVNDQSVPEPQSQPQSQPQRQSQLQSQHNQHAEPLPTANHAAPSPSRSTPVSAPQHQLREPATQPVKALDPSRIIIPQQRHAAAASLEPAPRAYHPP